MIAMWNDEIKEWFFELLDRDFKNWNIEENEVIRIKNLLNQWSTDTQKAQKEYYEEVKSANDLCLKEFLKEEKELKKKQLEELKKLDSLLKIN